MHLLIPFASALSEAASHALSTLALPNLARLLGRFEAGARVDSDEYSLTPPHERALAEAIGLQGGDGALPWAARAATHDGIDVGGRAWGLLTPAHWRVGSDGVSLADPAELHLAAGESKALLELLRPLFESEGFALAWGAPLRWYASNEALADLPCASLDRVIGRNVDVWLGKDAKARLVRRLQSEVQMTLYTHASNDEREAHGELAVNSFWLSGCGRAQATHGEDAVRVDDSLRAPLLADDWAAWAEAWTALDATAIASLLDAGDDAEAALTLCGERHAQRFELAARPLWRKALGSWRSASPHALLQSL
jgi:hypothetical protein